MLLVIDVGNTNTVLGVFEGEKLKNHWRAVTRRDRTADEYFIVFRDLLALADIPVAAIDGVCVSSVVPPLLVTLLDLSKRYFHAEPLVVGPGVKTGMSIHVDNPREVGADRIVDAVAAYEALHGAAIVIDFGTATTIDFVSRQGAFEGGVIAPGLAISTEALFKEASKLPRVELVAPKKVIGKNTVAAMQSGIVLGYASMIDAMVERMKEEVKKDFPGDRAPKVVATGGLSRLIAAEARSIEIVDEDLTLKGLEIIYRRNREDGGEKSSQ
jgi:type III pantothenate kinase